jgi:hypothetical protein
MKACNLAAMSHVSIQQRWLSATVLGLAMCALELATGAPCAAQSAAQSGTAASQPTGSAGARQLYASGETKYKAADYAGALNDFQAADAIKPASQSARFIGLCEDKLGHYPEAVAAYERFLSDVPAKLASEADGIKKRVEEIKAMPGHVHVESTPAGATVTIDGKAPTGQPGLSPVDADLPPGPHTVHVAAEGHEAVDRMITVGFGSKQDVKVDLPAGAPPPVVPIVAGVVPAPAPAPPPPPPPPPPRSKLPAIITGGLAIVAAGIGTGFGIVTLGDKSTFNKTPTEANAETGQNHALITDMSFGVAITLGVTSVVLLLTRDEPEAKKAASLGVPTIKVPKSAMTLRAAPIVTAHGGGAGALLSF